MRKDSRRWWAGLRQHLTDECLGMLTELAKLLNSLPALGISRQQVKPETRLIPTNWEAVQNWDLFRTCQSPRLLGPVHSSQGAYYPWPTLSVFCIIRAGGSVQLAIYVAWDDIPNDDLPIITGGGKKKRGALSHTQDVLLVPVVLRKREMEKDGEEVKSPITPS